MINLVTLYNTCRENTLLHYKKLLSVVSYICPVIEKNGAQPDDPLAICQSILELFYEKQLSVPLPELSVQSLAISTQDAEKPVLQFDLTPIVVVHFKRLQWDNTTKKAIFVRHPVHVDQLPEHNLVGCIMFRGSQAGGHYYALVKKKHLWFKLDDNKPIRKIQFDSLEVRKNVYIGVYAKSPFFQRPLQLIGLQNTGNSCFVNSALQVCLHSLYQ